MAASGVVSGTTDSNGNYLLQNVPAGLAVVAATKAGYVSQTLPADLHTGGHVTLDFSLTRGASRPRQMVSSSGCTLWLTGTYMLTRIATGTGLTVACGCLWVLAGTRRVEKGART
jgi:hypothetical protein